MKILFYLSHPENFHLFKNVFPKLENEGHQILIIIKKKDILEDLLIDAGFSYKNILPGGRKNSRFSMALSILKQDIGVFKYCIKNKPDIVIGTAVAVAHVGKLLNIPSIIINEDDANVQPKHSKLAYPITSVILSPTCCNNSQWEKKSIKYDSYHELAYLHPNNFSPDISVCQKYFPTNKPYFILRFSGLDAHHDKGIRGINDTLAIKIINILNEQGNVFITSEKPLIPEMEEFRKVINPLDIHHLLAFATLYIGDSQTMAAEAGVLGTPFIRFNDFVGRIGYLNELENKYLLGYGFKPNNSQEMLNKLRELLDNKDLKTIMNHKKEKMLNEKINLAALIVWFIENYPNSVKIMKENPDYQLKFK